MMGACPRGQAGRERCLNVVWQGVVGVSGKLEGLPSPLKKATLLSFNFLFWEGFSVFFFFFQMSLYFIRGVRSLETLCKISQFVQHLERPATHMSWLIYDQRISFWLRGICDWVCCYYTVGETKLSDRNRSLKQWWEELRKCPNSVYINIDSALG